MQKKNLVLLIAGLAILGLGIFFLASQKPASETGGDIASVQLEEPQLETQPSSEPQFTPIPEAETANLKPADIKVVVAGNQPSAPRSVGSIDAPVTMLDFSSLTCPHCARAHETVLPQLIKDYVETGKLRIVFYDFPLNQQALDASKVSRCMPNDQYFAFQTLLFATIEQWTAPHPQGLIQSAVLAGLSREKAESCMGDTLLEQAILSDVQDAAKKYNISSTPNFVFNDGRKTIAGARPYSEFKATIEGILANPAP